MTDASHAATPLRSSTVRRRSQAAAPAVQPIDPPSRYIARVSRATGEEIAGPDRARRAARPRPPRQPPASRSARSSWPAASSSSPATRAPWATGLRRVNALGGELADAGAAGRGQRRRRAAGQARCWASWTATSYFKFREPTHLSREGGARARGAAAARRARGAAGARPQPAAARAAHRRHRLPGQGDPRPGRGRPADRGGRGGGAAGDDPRPQDEGGREGPARRSSAARCC